MWKSPSTIHFLGLWLPDSQRRTPGHKRALKIFSQTLLRVQKTCFLRKIHTIQILIYLQVIQLGSNAAYLHSIKRRIKNRNFLACLRADTTKPQNRAISFFSSVSVYPLSNITLQYPCTAFSLLFMIVLLMVFNLFWIWIYYNTLRGKIYLLLKKTEIFVIKIRISLYAFWNYQEPTPFKALCSAVAQFWYFEKKNFTFHLLSFFNSVFITIALTFKRRFIFKLLK